MNPDLITLNTVRRGAFTMSEHGMKWAVVRAATKAEAAILLGDARLHRLLGSRDASLLTSLTGIGSAATEILTSKFPRPARGAALNALLARNLLLAPHGSLGFGGTATGNRFEVGELFSGIDSFVKRYARIAPRPLTKQAIRVLANIWLCSIEGKNVKPSVSVVEGWIKAHLREGGDNSAKWIDDLNDRIIAGLRNLGGIFDFGHVLRKYNRVSEVLRAIEAEPEFVHWRTSFNDWLDEKHMGAIDRLLNAFSLLGTYWVAHPHLLNPEVFFGRSTERTPLFDWTVARAGGLTKHLGASLRIIDEYLRWYVGKQTKFGVIDDWTGELILREECTWPIRNADLTKIAAISATTDRPAQSVQLALPMEYLNELEHILLDTEMAWPKQRQIDWIDWVNPETREVEKVYCPVLPLILLFMMRLPLRTVQVRRLDSGEGDAEYFNPIDNRWERNYGPHANYWEQARVGNKLRGVLRRIEDTWTGQTLCGFFINSNKTSDRKVLFSDKSGYVISWHNRAVIELVEKMRRWQEKYNPVAKPLAAADVRPGVFEKSAKIVQMNRPAVFHLFRYPGGNSGDFADSPPSGAQVRMFWYELLAELQRRLGERMENPPNL